MSLEDLSTLRHKGRVMSGEAQRELDSQKFAIAAEIANFSERQQLLRLTKAKMTGPQGGLLPSVVSMTPTERKNYSLSRAIMCMLSDDQTSLETELSAAIRQDLKHIATSNRGGLLIPTRLNPQASGLDTKTAGAGGYSVATTIRDLVDLLQAQMQLARLGATFLTGLSSNTSFATETQATAATWTGENPGSDVDPQDMAFGFVNLTPRTLQGSTTISRNLLVQNSVSLDRRISADLMRSHALAFDAAAINGSGLENEPIGLLQIPNISTVAINANGGVPTYSTICDLEANVANAGADFPSLGFLSTPNIRKKLRQTYINSTGSSPVWDGDAMLNRLALASTNVPSTLSKGSTNGSLHAIVCGAWSELILGEFGAIEIVVDRYTQARHGLVPITSFSMVDVCVPRSTAFSVCVDAALS